MATRGQAAQFKCKLAQCCNKLHRLRLMNQHSGMASLWTASCLILVTSLLGWLTLRSVMSETQRSQQQMFAAQALASSESLLETAIAQIDSVYSGQDIAIDAAFWRNASNSQCPATQTSLEWQCLKWTRSGVGTFDPLISELAWPESVDVTNSFVLFVRDVRMAPHKIKIMAQISLNSDQPGAGSRATVQQSLYIPISAPWTPPVSVPAPQPEPAECTPIEWRTQFGNITPAQLKAISTAQAQNGLTSVSQPSRTVYWIDSPLTWTQSLGTNSSPVVLIFSDTACALQCPQIASQAVIIGMVYFQSANACQNTVALHTLNAEAYHFDWPIGIDASKVQRVSGSWKNAGF